MDRQRIWAKELLHNAFLQANNRRRTRAYDAYEARQQQFTEKWLERGSFFDSTAETLNTLRPAWGDLEVERLLAQVAAAGELEQLAQVIEDVLNLRFADTMNSPEEAQQAPAETTAP